MPSRRHLFLCALLLAYAPAAWPQEEGDDDLLAPLAPLTPAETKVKRKKKKSTQPLPLVDKKAQEPQAPAKLAVRLADTQSGLKNARLFVDDKEVGVLPVEPLELAPGEHRVTVKRLGYAPFNATVKVKESGVTELPAALEALAGVINVSSEVVGAEVFVDGKSYGPVPVSEVVLAPGDHQIRLKREGYEEQAQMVNVKAGRDYNVRVNPTPLPAVAARTDRPERPARIEPRNPGTSSSGGALASTRVEERREEGGAWYGQWYVWAGGAAVAGGAAAAAVILTQPKNPCGASQCDACINAPPNMQQFCSALMRLPFVGLSVPVQ